MFGTVPAHGEVCAPGKSGMSAAARRKRLAIVGAGPSGLAAAWRLRDVPEIDVTVFEKSNGVFGRAATRTRHGVRLDPGANYFRTDLPEIASMVHSQLQSDDLIEIAGAIDDGFEQLRLRSEQNLRAELGLEPTTHPWAPGSSPSKGYRATTT